jgi:exodeoxyribonuclease VII small subunit
MAKQPTPSPDDSAAEPTFEEALEQLEGIVHELEEGQIGLDHALQRYEQGVKSLRRCYDLLQKAERRIELLSGVDAEGNPVTQPFDDRSSLSLEEKREGRSRRRSASGEDPTSGRGDSVDECGGRV